MTTLGTYQPAMTKKGPNETALDLWWVFFKIYHPFCYNFLCSYMLSTHGRLAPSSFLSNMLLPYLFFIGNACWPCSYHAYVVLLPRSFYLYKLASSILVLYLVFNKDNVLLALKLLSQNLDEDNTQRWAFFFKGYSLTNFLGTTVDNLSDYLKS